MNYELRRKMRQVGVQVQDYGTQLCWQTYVDKPDLRSDQLGLGLLVHIATPSSIERLEDPRAAIPPPDAIIKQEHLIDYMFPKHADNVGAEDFYYDAGLTRNRINIFSAPKLRLHL